MISLTNPFPPKKLIRLNDNTKNNNNKFLTMKTRKYYFHHHAKGKTGIIFIFSFRIKKIVNETIYLLYRISQNKKLIFL